MKPCLHLMPVNLRLALCSVKKYFNPHKNHFIHHWLPNEEYFNLVGLFFQDNFKWNHHISSIAFSAAKILSFFFRIGEYLSSINVYSPYIYKIWLSSEHCSHMDMSLLQIFKDYQLDKHGGAPNLLSPSIFQRSTILFVRYFVSRTPRLYNLLPDH